jgi:hypothetical protein
MNRAKQLVFSSNRSGFRRQPEGKNCVYFFGYSSLKVLSLVGCEVRLQQPGIAIDIHLMRSDADSGALH